MTSPLTLNSRIALAAYYLSGGLSHAEIARVLRVDASSVSRYLKQAEDRTWMRRWTELTLPPDVDERLRRTVRGPELEVKLAGAYAALRGRRDSRIVLAHDGIVVVRTRLPEVAAKPGMSDAEVRTMLGIEGANLLVDRLLARSDQAVTYLGPTWGRSTGSVVNACQEGGPVPSVGNVVTVPLQGGLGSGADARDGMLYADFLVRRLAALFGSQSPPLSLSQPAYVCPEVAAAIGDEGLNIVWQFIKGDLSHQQVSHAYERLDVALVGIGGMEPGAWATSSGYLPETGLMARLAAEGAVGDIACRHYRAVVEDPVESANRAVAPGIWRSNQRAIGITLTQLRDRACGGASIIAVAGASGGRKAVAIDAAIRNGFITDIVTDDMTAARLLALREQGEETDGA
jgi:DNA-binding transcriptional regulator LsrR (DeoR family)